MLCVTDSRSISAGPSHAYVACMVHAHGCQSGGGGGGYMEARFCAAPRDACASCMVQSHTCHSGGCQVTQSRREPLVVLAMHMSHALLTPALVTVVVVKGGLETQGGLLRRGRLGGVED